MCCSINPPATEDGQPHRIRIELNYLGGSSECIALETDTPAGAEMPMTLRWPTVPESPANYHKELPIPDKEEPDPYSGNCRLLLDLLNNIEKARPDCHEMGEWGIYVSIGLPCQPMFERCIEQLDLATDSAVEMKESLDHQNWTSTISADQIAQDHIDEFYDRRQRIRSIFETPWNAISRRRKEARAVAEKAQRTGISEHRYVTSPAITGEKANRPVPPRLAG